jgi:hypothetical protein
MAARSDEPDVNVEYFQVLEDGDGLHRRDVFLQRLL